MAKGLTPKQKRFCEEYLIDLNATQAYMRAGYSGTGSTATTNANRLLTNADIQAYIEKLQGKRQKRTEITADRVIQELAHIARRQDNMGLIDSPLATL